MTERRAKGKLVTVIAGLDPEANDLDELGARLKNACGAGGTVKDGRIELQGDHLQAAERALQAIGYKTRAGLQVDPTWDRPGRQLVPAISGPMSRYQFGSLIIGAISARGSASLSRLAYLWQSCVDEAGRRHVG